MSDEGVEITNTSDVASIDGATAVYVAEGLSLDVKNALVTLDGDEVFLPLKVFAVLHALMAHGGRLTTKDELIAQVWGDRVVSDWVLTTTIKELRKALNETTDAPRFIETVRGRGYRFKLPVETPVSTTSNTAPSDGTSVKAQDEPARLSEQISSEEGDATGKPPSIMITAVDIHPPSDDAMRFVEILGDEISAALSLNRDLEVATRTSSPDAKDDPLTTAKAANVDYAISIKMTPANGAGRLRLQLTAVADRRIVGTETFAEPDLSGIVPEDDFVVETSSWIYAAVMREATRRAMTKQQNVNAWEAVIRSRSAYQRISIKSLQFAVSEARRAVELDPNFASGRAALALSLAGLYEVSGGTNKDLAKESHLHADRALALDPDDPTVLTFVASGLGMITRPAEGFELAERAVQLAPHHPFAHLYLARHYLYKGRPEDALKALDAHDRAAPRFPWQYYVAFLRALSEYLAGRIDAAERWYDLSATLNPDYPFSWISKAILYVLTDRFEKAVDSVRRLKQLEGNDSRELQVSRISHAHPDQATTAILVESFLKVWDHVDAEDLTA